LTECKAVTIYDCLNSPAGSLAKLEREGVNTQALVKYLLSDLVEVFNFGKNMSDTQLTNCANSLIELYWNFTPEDFKRCCFNIKACKYIEKFYESMDEPKIQFCFKEYNKERIEEIETLRQKEASLHKQELKEPLLGDEVFKKMGTLAESLLKKDEKKELPKREKTEMELLMDAYILEFDNLYKSQDKGGTGQRFVLYDKRMLSVEEYCNKRFSEDNN
jgi:hypothetical protein